MMVEGEPARIVTRVQPNASQNQLVGFKGGVLYLRIAAPPTKGKANQELVKFLSHILGVTKSSLTIEKGMTSKTKTIAIKGLKQDQVMLRLEKP